MAFTPMTGILGAVKVGATAYAFQKWKAQLKGILPKVNNFTSAYQQLVGGLTSATVTLTGPYDEGNMPFTVTTAYTFVLFWNATISLSIPCLLESIEGTQDVEDAGRVELTGQSTGTFTAAIV